jgi:hypothetical protein
MFKIIGSYILLDNYSCLTINEDRIIIERRNDFCSTVKIIT